MSKFRVGQRVRIKWSNAWPELAGQVGTIVSSGEYSGGHPEAGKRCWLVAPDSWGTHVAPNPIHMGTHIAVRFGPQERQLEPATDCYDKTEWDACVWKPEHLRVGA